jgi:hypothetical protein
MLRILYTTETIKRRKIDSRGLPIVQLVMFSCANMFMSYQLFIVAKAVNLKYYRSNITW